MNSYKNKKIQFFVLILLFLHPGLHAQIPARPDPPRLVNDFASLMSPQEVDQLESKLVAYDDSTSTQIVVVTLSSLDGYDIDDLAQRIGQSWGVGQKETENGIVILIKPKVGNESGKAAISTGYGMEELIPDAIARRIVDNEMIPYFKENNYYGGINAGTDIIFDLASGRFKAKDIGKESPLSFIIPLIIILLVIFFLGRNSNNRHHNIGSTNLPLWILLSMLGNGGGGGRGSGGGWGGPSGGFGGGGGGFGGFGGGSFGGGGASGSW